MLSAKKVPRVIEPRLMVSDASLEAIQMIAADTHRGLLAHFDEKSTWDQQRDRYSRNPSGERGPWLSAYGGQRLVVDRKGNGAPVEIDCWALSVLTACPPNVLDATISADSVNDGFDARLIYLTPPPPPLTLRPAATDEASMITWARVINRVIDWRLQATTAQPLTLADEALETFERWRHAKLSRARAQGRDVSAWEGKLPGLLLRVAGNIAILDAAMAGDTPPTRITLGQIKRAAKVVDAFTAHRRRLEMARGVPPVVHQAAEMAAWILQHRVKVINTFEARSIVPGARSSRAVGSILRELDAAGWLATPLPKSANEPLPRAVMVNPQVFRMAAAQAAA